MEEKKKSHAKIVGLLLGLFVNIFGLLGIFIYKDNDEDRSQFIKGWLIGAKAINDTLDFANSQMQNFPAAPKH